MEARPTGSVDNTRDPAGDSSRMKEIFAEASDLPLDLREEYLKRHCGSDMRLRATVDRLLKAHDEAGPFLAQPTHEPSTEDLPTGQKIGRYKLLQKIGEGGFGTVYMAEQEEPVRRRVALKIIKLGMDTKAVIARFEAERQALAMMDHPNIARVFDAGSTDSGRPYFVMELVHGIPITQYCDSTKLSTRDRLQLFMPVCRAVQHAHQKGIIHRDIKPSNVLVTLHDGVPVPKVIDFGIAKATSHRLTDKTLFTEFRQFIGTPEYMSPEQAEMSGLDIDTRSDIYSLGVLLYELLTGTTPFDAKSLRSAAYGEIQRIIREVEPPRPSTRISSLGETLATTAAQRGTDSRKLSQVMRGELDWIVMRCMEKDRTRRYETATSVAADIQRYLNDEVVEASPPSTAYKLRKLARRYRNPLHVVVGIALLLIAATIFSSWQAVLATRAKAAALAEKQRADDQAAIAEAVNKFLNEEVLGQASPYFQANPEAQMKSGVQPSIGRPEAKPNRDLTVRDALDRALANNPNQFASEPRVEAAIRSAVGRAYKELGEYDKAELHLGICLKLNREALGDLHPDTLRAMKELAELYDAQRDFKKAEPLFLQAIDGQRKILGNQHPDTLETMSCMATLYFHTQDFAKAQPLAQQAYDGWKIIRGERNRDTLVALFRLAAIYFEEGQKAKAAPLEEKALAAQRELLGEEHPDTLRTMNNLAASYSGLGDKAKAEPLFSEAFQGEREVLGDTHPLTILTGTNLARTLRDEKKYVASIALSRQLLTIEQEKGLPSADIEDAMSNLAFTLQDGHQVIDAIAVFRQVLAAEQEKGLQSPGVPEAMRDLAFTLHLNAQDQECERLYRGAIAFAADSWSEPAARADTIRNLAVFLTQKRRFEEAEPVWADLCKWITANAGDSVYGLTAGYLRQQVQWFYQRWEKPIPSQWDQDINQMFEAAITESSTQIGRKDAPLADIISSLSTRADLYETIGQHRKAIADWVRMLQLQRESPGELQSDIDSTAQRLANDYLETNEISKAEPLFRQVMEDRRRTLGELDPNTLYATEAYGFFKRDRLHDPAAAAEIFHQTLSVWRTIPGDHSYQIANMSRHLGWTEHMATHEDEAIRLQQIALAYPLDTWPNRYERAYGVRELARTFTDVRRYAEAEPLWLELAQWVTDHPNPGSEFEDLDPSHVLPMIQNFYWVWGKPIPATFEAVLLIKAPTTTRPIEP